MGRIQCCHVCFCKIIHLFIFGGQVYLWGQKWIIIIQGQLWLKRQKQQIMLSNSLKYLPKTVVLRELKPWFPKCYSTLSSKSGLSQGDSFLKWCCGNKSKRWEIFFQRGITCWMMSYGVRGREYVVGMGGQTDHYSFYIFISIKSSEF